MVDKNVLVIGGGPAGLAAAIAARSKGFDVTVLEAAHPPIDKACGEAILPTGVEVLRHLGVRLSANDGFPLRGIRFLGDGARVEAAFPSGDGLALRRTALHILLASRAAELGIALKWATPVRDLCRFSPDRWIIGADGQNSRVRRAAGLESAARVSSRFAFRRHYRICPWADYVEVYWNERCQIYITPVAPAEVGVALLTRDTRLRLDPALEEFPELQRRLRGAPASSTVRGALTVSRRLHRVFRGRTVLIGDASGSSDAITGDGLNVSFQQAVLLAEALSSNDLACYQSEHSRLARHRAVIERLLLTLDRHPTLRRYVLRALAWEPPAFAALLASHTA